MPQIETLNELLDRLGGVVMSVDPLAALHSRGFTLAREVQESLDAARTSIRL